MTLMNLQFSTTPGCWERHLQRRYQNPLFLHYSQPVTQTDIDTAHRRDEDERRLFQQDFLILLQDVTTLQNEVKTPVVLKLRERIDSLYERVASFGGDFHTEKRNLRTLSDLITQSILSSGVRDPQVLANLERETAARHLHFSLLEHAFVAHLLLPYSPIVAGDIVPSMLTEEETALRAAMSLFDLQRQQLLCQEARRLLIYLKAKGHAVPVAWSRLITMERSVQ